MGLWSKHIPRLTESGPEHSVKPFDAFDTKTPQPSPALQANFTSAQPDKEEGGHADTFLVYHCTLQARSYGLASLTLIPCGKGSI
ncbi:hypothetical protein QQF64_029765 [Cirrhinus molitorella]|uniref:Uncharacterized protein n=1 Tax=Cirrhinus molitorella TaxID=172907 RepID=A0ABR3N1J2_9TELE